MPAKAGTQQSKECQQSLAACSRRLRDPLGSRVRGNDNCGTAENNSPELRERTNLARPQPCMKRRSTR